ncbi:MAG: DUF5947 family protein [Gammaproteobacteria bacterium]
MPAVDARADGRHMDMDQSRNRQAGNWVAALQGFVGPQQAAVERCEVCRAEIGPEHAHLIEPESRRLLCACQACALLFDSPEAKRYRRVPRTVTRLDDFELSDAEWDAFRIPINMAFFFRSSPRERIVGLYPGPAGATESLLDMAAWETLSAANPVLGELEEDVEALLVNRVQGAHEYYRVPIDRCYALVGQIRKHWHGISGGSEVQETIRSFFGNLSEEAQPLHA